MEVKRRGTFQNWIVTQLLSVIIVLLLFITSIGIVGMTSFAVTKRTRQIGTRRALGATQLAIVRLFLIENGLITAAGIAIGLIALTGVIDVLVQITRCDLSLFNHTDPVISKVTANGCAGTVGVTSKTDVVQGIGIGDIDSPVNRVDRKVEQSGTNTRKRSRLGWQRCHCINLKYIQIR